jgi:hypothetical protein
LHILQRSVELPDYLLLRGGIISTRYLTPNLTTICKNYFTTCKMATMADKITSQ